MTKKEYDEKMAILLATEKWLESERCELKKDEKQRRLEKMRARKEMLQDTQLIRKDEDELVLLFE